MKPSKTPPLPKNGQNKRIGEWLKLRKLLRKHNKKQMPLLKKQLNLPRRPKKLRKLFPNLAARQAPRQRHWLKHRKHSRISERMSSMPPKTSPEQLGMRSGLVMNKPPRPSLRSPRELRMPLNKKLLKRVNNYKMPSSPNNLKT